MSKKLSMKFLSAVAFLLAVSFSYQCIASARVAKNPVAVRETYADRTSSELTCSEEKCMFTISGDGSSRAFGFNGNLHGYRISVDAYAYFEGAASQPFMLSIDVACSDADVRAIPDADVNDVQCSLQLYPNGKKLVAEQVRVSAIVAGRYVTRIRKLTQSQR